MIQRVIGLITCLAILRVGAAAAQDGPFHLEVVCPSGSCPADLDGELTRFEQEAMHYPGSTLVVRTSSERPRLLVCVPQTWGGASIMAQKRHFREEVRKLAAALTTGNEPVVYPNGDCHAPSLETGGVFSLHVVGPEAVQWTKIAQKSLAKADDRLTVVLCDGSESAYNAHGVSCDPEALGEAYDEWLRGVPGPNARLRLYLIGTDARSAQQPLELSVPKTTPGATLGYFLQQRERFAAAAPKAPIHNGSAIMEALRVAEAETNPAHATRRFIVVSDLRQYSAGRWNFEKRVPKSDAFLAQLKRDGLAVNLEGARVDVCRFPFKPDVATAELVRDTWSRAVQGMGGAGLVVASRCEFN